MNTTNTITKIRSYSELSKLKTFEERFEYLKLDGAVGADTFGFNRYLREMLHKSPEWKKARRETILRDQGCDLGIEDRVITGRVMVHHMNPVTVEQILNRDPIVYDPEYLISTAHITHNAIHYGDEDLLIKDPIERSKNDTCPWRRD